MEVHNIIICSCIVLAEMHNMDKFVHIFLSINFLKIMNTIDKLFGKCAKIS